MAGSEAEERIRAKVEAALRREFPDARIVHEVNTSWGGVRMDLAAVRPNALTLVEIKSERDVLKRLPDQAAAALEITGDVRVYAAEKHRAGLTLMSKQHLGMVWNEDRTHGRHEPNPAYCPALRRCRVMLETDEGFSDLEPVWGSWWPRLVMQHAPDPRSMLEMLWAEELRDLMRRHSIGAPPRANRTMTKLMAQENLTGRQVREGVCSALRARPFARADEVAA